MDEDEYQYSFQGSGARANNSLVPAFSQLGVESIPGFKAPSDSSSLTSSGSNTDLSDSSSADSKTQSLVSQLRETVRKLENELEHERNKNEGFGALKSLSGEEQAEIARLKHQVTKLTSQKTQLEHALKEADRQSLSSIQNEWDTRTGMPDMSAGAFSAVLQENIHLKQTVENLEGKLMASQAVQKSDRDVSTSESATKTQDASMLPLSLHHSESERKAPQDLSLYHEMRSLLTRFEQGMATNDHVSKMHSSVSYPSHLSHLNRQNVSEVTAELHNENASLREQLQQKDEKLREVVAMNTRWQSYNDQRDAYVQQLQKKSSEMSERSSQLGEEQQRQVDQLITQYKRKTTAMEDEKIKIEDENRQLRRDLEEKRKEKTALDNTIISLQRQLEERQKHASSGSSTDSDTIDMLKAQIQICTEDFQSERRDKERAMIKLTESERELNVVKEQLRQFQGSYMESFADRRAAALQKYQDEYRMRHPNVMSASAGGLLGRGGFQTDGVEDAPDEDMIDIPLPVSPQPQPPSQLNNSLLCPRCKKEFPANQHTALLDHIDVCCD